MKSKCKLIAVVFVISILSSGLTAFAIEKEKEYQESWPASDVSTLQVVNKFGKVQVKNNGSNEVTIDVKVTVEAANERKANELLGKINVKFRKNGSTVEATTTIAKDFKSQKKFSIDYEINIPSDKNLDISNKYGDTFVNELNADGTFNIQYGNLNANALNAPGGSKTDIALAYGNASIGSGADLQIVVKYSNMSIGEIDDMNLESKYSVVEVEMGSTFQIESKYDKFRFDKVESVTATTKYSNLKIEMLGTNLKIESGYGGVKVDEVNPGFKSISITNSYGEIALGLGDLNYTVDARCEYCGIAYPENNFAGNKMKEKQTQQIEGKVGTGEGGSVNVKSRYGSIKLK